jgi:DUF1365 family protein
MWSGGCLLGNHAYIVPASHQLRWESRIFNERCMTAFYVSPLLLSVDCHTHDVRLRELLTRCALRLLGSTCKSA